MRFLHWAKDAFRLAGIDQAVAFTLAGHLWNVVTAPLLLLLMVRRLEAGERGVLFNFISICQVQLILALGIGTVIQQLASRQRAFLQPWADGTFGGDRVAKQRLASMFRVGLAWFIGWAMAAFVILLPIGWWFFFASPGTESVAWELPWILTLLVAVVDAAVNSLFLFLSGCGHVTEVARVTALKQTVMTMVLMLGLLGGIRLLAHPISGLAGVLLSLAWLLLTRRRLFLDLWRTPQPPDGFHWRTDVWPLQWRVSLSWLCTMVVMHGLNPATLYWKGADQAGRVGLSVYILLTIQNMGWGWVATRIPTFGILAAQRQWRDLVSTFRAVLLRSSIFILLVAGGLVAISAVLHHQADISPSIVGWLPSPPLPTETPTADDPHPDPHLSMAQPLLPPGPLAMLLLAVLALHVFLAQAALLRAHGQDPLFPVAVLMSVSVTAVLALTGLLASTLWMVAAYSFVVSSLCLGLGTWVTRWFLRSRHSPS